METCISDSFQVYVNKINVRHGNWRIRGTWTRMQRTEREMHLWSHHGWYYELHHGWQGSSGVMKNENCAYLGEKTAKLYLLHEDVRESRRCLQEVSRERSLVLHFLTVTSWRSQHRECVYPWQSPQFLSFCRRQTNIAEWDSIPGISWRECLVNKKLMLTLESEKEAWLQSTITAKRGALQMERQWDSWYFSQVMSWL